jgi:hypothetical protein
LRSCENLNLMNQSAGWKPLANMTIAHYSTSGILLPDGNSFMVAGGSGTKTCEILRISSNVWTSVASLLFSRDNHCAILYDGRAVVLGGWNSALNQLKTAEQYVAQNNSWIAFPSFSTPRERFGAAVVNGRIYIAGGFNGTSNLASVEVFVNGTTWITSPSLALNRIQHVAVSYQDKLVVFGGDRSTAVEVYDPATSKWNTTLIPSMKFLPIRKDFASFTF